MAKGQVFTIASNASVLKTTQTRTEKSAFAILNPNDGVLYVAIDRNADSSLSGWDWKLPSQSYGLFPGPWTSVGLYYLDQSGAGVAGEFNLYDSDDRIYLPDIHSVGRALQARQNTLDVTQGTTPPNPSIGVVRVWADNAGYLDKLRSDGSGGRIWDSQLAQAEGIRGYVLAALADVNGGSQAAGITAANNTWGVLSGVYGFTKISPNTDILVLVRYLGYVNAPGTNNALVNLSLQLDPGGGGGSGSASKYFGNVWAPVGANGAFFSCSSFLRFTGIAAGIHNWRVDGFFQGTCSVFCSPGAGQDFQLLTYEVYG